MKRFIALLLITLLSTGAAYAAGLTYSPEVQYLSIAPGESAEIPVTIELVDGGSGTYYLWYVNSIYGGDLPLEWLSTAKSSTFLNKWWPQATTTIKVTVPADAEPGTYGGYMLSKAMKSHLVADPGAGMFIEVTVSSKCSAAPRFEITGVGPLELWPPDKDMDNVTVTGVVTMDEGCSIYEAGYSVDDEYGVYSGVGALSIAGDGSFEAIIPLEASREGRDKDGRKYIVTIYTENDAGIGTSEPYTITVPHDKGH